MSITEVRDDPSAFCDDSRIEREGEVEFSTSLESGELRTGAAPGPCNEGMSDMDYSRRAERQLGGLSAQAIWSIQVADLCCTATLAERTLHALEFGV